MVLETIFTILISVAGILIAMLFITRIFGLRTFVKMSSLDFASTIAVGSILATIIINENQSILKGLTALFFIIGFQMLFSFLVRRVHWFKKLFTNKPKFLMKDGKILYQNLKKCNVDKSTLMAKLRESNVHELEEVQAVVFESTGDVSVLHSSESDTIEDLIIEDVNL